MKNHLFAVSKLVAAAVCALSLGSCSRAEYAMLPKGASYHGVARAATPVPVRAASTTAPAVVVPATSAPETVALSSTPAVVAAPASVQTVAAPAPAAAEKAEQITVASALAAAPVVAKSTLIQRLALNKVTHKLDKLMQKAGSVRQHENTASTARGASVVIYVPASSFCWWVF